MIEVYGHQNQRRRLEQELPVVTLIQGPQSVGKWTLASYLVQYHRVTPADVRVCERLNMEAAREVVAFARRAPFGPFKVAQLNLDDATDQVLTTLLKLLEEPPASMRFILTASRGVLDTVVSRATLVRLGLLSDSDVFNVLTKTKGMRPDQARPAATLARGQVAPALLVGEIDQSKNQVLTVVKAIADRDPRLLGRVAEGQKGEDGRITWGPEEHRMLQVWAVEALTSRWRVFAESESFGVDRDKGLVRRVLLALGNANIADARPHLALRVALSPLVSV